MPNLQGAKLANASWIKADAQSGIYLDAAQTRRKKTARACALAVFEHAAEAAVSLT
ncbi:hypothetical protein [Janthinobacterium sp. BJB304]|uniref:hypothetical protein n=1 Tax=Janthinobacterium sp. BJB304 TaxID=1572871 RepID=UPI0015D4CE5D|nr:hypothetical protein [Janthinobacterium sp. BJB304]